MMATRGKGSVWAPEWRVLKDPVSGATIRQLTNYFCHNYHLYFTEPGWYDDGRRLVFEQKGLNGIRSGDRVRTSGRELRLL